MIGTAAPVTASQIDIRKPKGQRATRRLLSHRWSERLGHIAREPCRAVPFIPVLNPEVREPFRRNEGYCPVGRRGSQSGGSRCARQPPPDEMPMEMLFHKKLLTDKALR